MTARHRIPSGNSASSPYRQRLAFFPYMLFFFVPLSLLGVFAWYGLSLAEDSLRAQATRALERELETLIQEADPMSLFPKWFERIMAEVFRQGDSAEKETRQLQAMIPSGPLTFECYRFDASGTPIVPHDLPESIVNDVFTLGHALREMHTSKRAMTLLADRWLGVNFPIKVLIQHKGEAFYTKTTRGIGLIDAFQDAPLPHSPQTVFIVNKVPTMVQVLTSPVLQDLIPKFRQPTLLTITGIDGVAHRIKELETYSNETLLGANSSSFHVSPPQRKELVRVVKHSGEETFYALRETPNSHLFLWRALLITGLATLSFILVLSFPVVSRQFSRSFISIRWKISLLFLYAIIIPIAGGALLGFQTIRDRRETLESQIHQKALQSLAELDSGFSLEKKNVLRKFQRYCQKLMDAPELESVVQQTKKMQINQEVALVEIRDIRANILYSSCNLSEMERLAIVMDTIAKVCLKRFHPNLSTTAEALDLSMVEVFTQTFFLSPLVGWPRILERPDELHDLRFAERNLFFYWNVLPTSRTSAAYVQIQQHVLQQQRLYLLDQLRTNQEFQGGAFRFFAWNESSRDLLPHGRFLPFQGRKLFQRLRTSREPIMSEITVQGNRYLASGFPGGHLGDHHLLALFPASIIDDAMQKLTISFVLGTFIVCLLALIFGFILSESFMRPIQELSAGVLALRERDVSRRVTVLSNDELGAFAVTFNQTLDGLQEMLLAHEVQRQLIPETLPPIPGYQAFLMSHPARDLGGDYCDVQALPDGRFTLVIGDATGHSVGSALVMAMAKACVLDFVLGGIPLSELMKRINTLFYMNLRRKIYMTFFASVLEPATGTLQFSNAGHPFPIMIDIEGNVSRLKLSHPPLGFSPRGDGFQQAEVTIAPGSLVLFFTDIMMEVCNQKGVPWGPRNLIEFVRERRICSAQVIGQELLQFAQTYSGSNSFEDDFTMVILKRDQ